ncbi:dTDP-fucosamine acetyltransferase [Paraburkholderia domus]|uniref:GNAT family N-acetyltransferase n=1 Tax=Paraburkholderia domus TaxID=2793075 RepID=UPI001913235D|nr:GNAT family N-acetyltransferase [Paraburkholderia domus]MBK5052531.1 GNAT family N-acetyltransferase [Burkholderia sp. R-70006]CAE6812093.1 dTDP-fucosamine acetyltransferase [Paraburkholderia domus]CAE6889218.1 dTDP-fucosamine acetyltransferase [Paraburkholderia domus]
MEARLSDIDKARFGVSTLKISADANDRVDDLLAAQQDTQAQLSIIRVPSDHLHLVQDLEEKGAFLADSLVYFRKKQVSEYAEVLPVAYTYRLATPADAERVEELAKQTFQGYLGHYHADRRLERADCDAVYESWAGNSCRDEAVASSVILIERDQEIAAFATLKIADNNAFEGVLFGVSPAHQGKGLYMSLMKLAENWGNERKIRQMFVSTQVTNSTVQKAWCRLGFEPYKSYYTLHRWTTDGAEHVR